MLIRTHRIRVGCTRASAIAAAMLAICSLTLSQACADVSSRWFAPVELFSTVGGAGNMEVVLQVTPASKPGPFEYIYWVTNSAPTAMSDFYLTCVGLPDLSSIDTAAYSVFSGTRELGPGGAVTFQRGAGVGGWGDITLGIEKPNARLQTIYDETSQQYASSVKFRWSVLADGGLEPGGSIGFAFTSTYSPAAVARDLAATFAIRTYNGSEYAYGPEPDAIVPEWSTVMLALSGFGCLGAFGRRFRG